jgi:hypothetical protein
MGKPTIFALFAFFCSFLFEEQKPAKSAKKGPKKKEGCLYRRKWAGRQS